MTDLAIEKFQQLLDDHLGNSDELKTLEEETEHLLSILNSERATISIRLQRRFWRYFGLFDRMFTNTGSREYWVPSRKIPLLKLTDETIVFDTKMDIAVHMHVYFLDLLPELLFQTQNIGQEFTCYVTTDQKEKASVIQALLTHHPLIKSFKVIVTPNRGRDIAPWIIEMAPYNNCHELWCHIHTKKSLHVPTIGDTWRNFLLAQIIGNKDSVRRIFLAFNLESDLGMVIPPFYIRAVRRPFNKWDDRVRAKQFFKSLGIKNPPPRHPVFSAGSMFWYRPEALSTLFQKGFEYDDFELETNQVAGTIAHIIERSLVYVTKDSGLEFRVIVPAKTVNAA